MYCGNATLAFPCTLFSGDEKQCNPTNLVLNHTASVNQFLGLTHCVILLPVRKKKFYF